MPEHAGAEDERRQDPPPAARGVEGHARTDRANAYAGNVRLVPALPLAQRDERDVVAGRGQPFAEVAVPALGTADGVGEEAVVDEADAHERAPERTHGDAAGVASIPAATLTRLPRQGRV